MSKKEENQRKAIKGLLDGIEYRNKKILRLLEENRALRKNNFELYLAVLALDAGGIRFRPYGGFTDPYIKKILADKGFKVDKDG